MSRREDIDNSIWSDPDFHSLTPNAKLVYLWSFTNPRCGMAGVYTIVPAVAALETGLHGDQLDEALNELGDARFVHYDRGVLWVRSRVKHLRTKTEQIAKSITRDLEQVGGPVCEAFLNEYRDTAWAHLRALLLNLTRTSGEVHETSDTYAENGDPQPRVTRTSGEVPGQGKGKGTEEQHGPSRVRTRQVDPDSLPNDFPFELAEPVTETLSILTRLHAERGGKAPSRRGVALAVRRFPGRDHVAVAHDLERWATVGNGARQPIKSWDQRYATFLDHAADATPARPANGTKAGPVPIDDVIAAHERYEQRMASQRAEREGAPT